MDQKGAKFTSEASLKLPCDTSTGTAGATGTVGHPAGGLAAHQKRMVGRHVIVGDRHAPDVGVVRASHPLGHHVRPKGQMNGAGHARLVYGSDFVF